MDLPQWKDPETILNYVKFVTVPRKGVNTRYKFAERIIEVDMPEIDISSTFIRKRIKNKELPATQVWLWGQGYKPKLPGFYEKYGIKGSVITAVDLIRGIAKLAGLVVVNVKGATGFVNTNYEGKADAALKSLEYNDFVFIHVEAPDEAGHSGDLKMKVKAIENIDKRLLGRLLEKIKGDYRILVMPDHPTPIRIKTHTSKPVPFILFGEGIKSGNIIRYSEKEAKKSKIFIEEGYKIINLLFQRKININLK